MPRGNASTFAQRKRSMSIDSGATSVAAKRGRGRGRSPATKRSTTTKTAKRKASPSTTPSPLRKTIPAPPKKTTKSTSRGKGRGKQTTTAKRARRRRSPKQETEVLIYPPGLPTSSLPASTFGRLDEDTLEKLTKRANRQASAKSSPFAGDKPGDLHHIPIPEGKRGVGHKNYREEVVPDAAHVLPRLKPAQRKYLESAPLNDLKPKLRLNGLRVAGRRPELMARVAYAVLHGVPGNESAPGQCPDCHHGLLHFREGGFFCPGYFDKEKLEFAHCHFDANRDDPRIKIYPWKKSGGDSV